LVCDILEPMHNKIAITTSSACVSAEEAKEYGVTMIPFHIIMDGKGYLDSEIDTESLYARLDEKQNLPITPANNFMLARAH
jgi:fatty acid-binding protein DegV